MLSYYFTLFLLGASCSYVNSVAIAHDAAAVHVPTSNVVNQTIAPPTPNDNGDDDNDMSEERFTCKVINHTGLRLALAAWPSKLASGAYALQSFSSPSQAWDDTVGEPGTVTNEPQVRIYANILRIEISESLDFARF